MATTEKKKVEKKPETKLVITVLAFSHGYFLGKHDHYMTSAIEVPADYKTELIAEAAKASAEMANDIGIKRDVRVITCEEVHVDKIDDIRARAAALRSLIKK